MSSYSESGYNPYHESEEYADDGNSAEDSLQEAGSEEAGQDLDKLAKEFLDDLRIHKLLKDEKLAQSGIDAVEVANPVQPTEAISNQLDQLHAGYYENLQEAMLSEVASSDEHERRHIEEFLKSGEAQRIFVNSRDEVKKLERVKLVDQPLEYIYLRELVKRMDLEYLWRLDKNEHDYNSVIDSMFLHNTESGRAVNLSERTPGPMDLIQHKHGGEATRIHGIIVGGGKYDFVTYPKIESLEELITLLHEVGHGWESAAAKTSSNNKKVQPESESEALRDDNNKSSLVAKERGAWAWALKEIGRLSEVGIITDPNARNKALATAEYYLATYEHEPEIFESSEFATSTSRRLKRRLNMAIQAGKNLRDALKQQNTTEFIGVASSGELPMTTRCSLDSENRVWLSIIARTSDGKLLNEVMSIDDQVLYRQVFTISEEDRVPVDSGIVVSNLHLKLTALKMSKIEFANEFVDYHHQASHAIDRLERIAQYVVSYNEVLDS